MSGACSWQRVAVRVVALEACGSVGSVWGVWGRAQRSRRPPRQQLLQLHAPAICFSGGSRLPFARPQTPKRFQRSRRPPRQQLLQLHVPKPSKRFQPSRRPPRPCHLFFRGSRLPFARPQTPQTLPTLPQASKATTLTATCPQTLQTLPTLSQASKATTLTATCPCHLFFRGFKTAVCPPSNPPKRFQRSRRPPRQQLLQLHVQRSRRPPRQQLLQLHAPAICFSGGSRLPFARPQTPQTLPTLPQASKATTLTATCPCHLFFRGFKTAVCPPSNPPNASNAPAGLQGNNSYSYMSLPSVFQGVQDCRRKHSYMPLPSVFHGVQDCRLPGLKPSKRFQPSRRPPRQQLLQLHAPAICFSGGSRLPFARPLNPVKNRWQGHVAVLATAVLNPLKNRWQGHVAVRVVALEACGSVGSVWGVWGRAQRSRRPPRQQLLQLHVPAICFSGVQDCRRKQRHTQRLPGLKPSKRFRTPPRQQLLQLLHAPAICFSGGLRLPFARPQTPQTLPTLPQASKATTLTATCPCHLFFTGFKTAVCPASNVPNASNAPAGLQGNNSYSYPLSATCPRHLPCSCRTLTPTCPRTFKTAVCPASNPPNASAGLQGNNSYMPQDVQDCRLPGLWTSWGM